MRSFRDGESDFGGEGHSAGCARGPRRIGGARRIGYSLRRSHFGGARIAYDGKFVINPTFSDNARADIDIMVGATIDNILMVEGEMNEVSEADMLEPSNSPTRR